MEIPFVGGEYQDYSRNIDAQVSQNFFVVVDEQGGKSKLSLEGSPGIRSYLNLGYIVTGTKVHYAINVFGRMRAAGSVS